jgi:hypothetical protein
MTLAFGGLGQKLCFFFLPFSVPDARSFFENLAELLPNHGTAEEPTDL